MRTRGERDSFGNPAPAYPPPTLRGKTSVAAALGYAEPEPNGTTAPDNSPDTSRDVAPFQNAVRVWSGIVAASLLCAPYAAGGMGDAP